MGLHTVIYPDFQAGLFFQATEIVASLQPVSFPVFFRGFRVRVRVEFIQLQLIFGCPWLFRELTHRDPRSAEALEQVFCSFV